MSNDEATNFLFGGGGKAASFENVGDEVKGIVTDVKLSQQTSMEDNTPLTWPDGSPRLQLVISLQTDLRESDDDDGIRRVFAKGGKYQIQSGTGTSMKDAVADAVKKAEARSLDEGGTLRIAHTGLGAKTNRGYSAPKLYRAVYEPPKASVSADELFSSS